VAFNGKTTDWALSYDGRKQEQKTWVFFAIKIILFH
jgi:hypothetical protein